MESIKVKAMEQLRFDPEKHKYFVGKKEIPSVSSILKKVGLVKSYEGIDPYFAQRGIATHLANELWLKGTLDESSLDPQVKPFHMAFRDYVGKATLGDGNTQLCLIEEVLYSEKEGFACRIDYYWGGLLVDAKCTKRHDRGSDYQLCLQALSLEESGFPVKDMQILELHEDGTHDSFSYPVDHEIAKAVMKLYRRRLLV